MYEKTKIYLISFLAMAVVLATSNQPLNAQEERDVSFGFSIMFGGRYDDLRMCVASPAGVKGGMIGDIALNTRFHVRENLDMVFTLPVMRPILFALAFQMLQFEPEVTFEFKHPLGGDSALVAGLGLGASFHYGPDYKSDLENRGESFFAIGPFFSGIFGIGFPGIAGKDTLVGVRAFYVPLFSKDRAPGTVIGGALEGQMYF